MNVWRKQSTRYLLNGKRTTKRTKGAVAETILSKRFYGTLKLADGKRKQVPLTEERKTSEALLRRLQTTEDEARANGLLRPYVDRQRPVNELVAEYLGYLRSKGNTPEYVDTVRRRLRNIFNATKTKTVADLDANRIVNVLASWRKRSKKPISVGTSNHYVTCVKSFSRWLWTERKTPEDILLGLRKLDAKADRRRVRRALTQDELGTLTVVTQQSGKTYRGDDWRFTPTDRTMLYMLAAYTGLRASELASLTKASFCFETLTLTLPANVTKNRKACTLPLNATLSQKLQEWFATLKREAIFPGSWALHRMGGKMLKRDLKRAGIAYRDERGRCVDFHALRYTFITSLARAGVHPAKAQRLARHSTITLTMDVYTSLDVDDLRDAVNGIFCEKYTHLRRG